MAGDTTVRATAAPAVARLPWATALVLASAMFLVLFDSLAIATALPQIGADFRLTPTNLQWVITLYSLSIGGFLLLGGRLADLTSRRRLVIGSLTLATIGYAVAALAPGLTLLLAGRVMQGVAAALAIPATLAVAAGLFPQEPWRSRVFSVVAAAANTAGLVGAVCGGFITTHLGWRWVFLIPIPLGVAAAVAAAWLLPPDRPATTGERLDVVGALLATLGLLGVIYGISEVPHAGLGIPTAAPAAAGMLLLIAFVARERRAADPLVRPALIRSRRMIAGGVAFWLHSTVYAAVVVVGSIYLQDVFGLDPAGAGLVLAPVLLASLASSTVAGTLVRRFGPRRVVAAALAVGAVILTLFFSTAGDRLPVVVCYLVAWGFSAGPIYVGLTRACVGDADEADRGMATALFESTTHVSGALAIALFLSLLEAGAGYGVVYLVAAACAVLGSVTTMLIMPRHADPLK